RMHRPPRSPPFPYTTLFRSLGSRITAAVTTAPTSGPRPTSSTPATSKPSRQRNARGAKSSQCGYSGNSGLLMTEQPHDGIRGALTGTALEYLVQRLEARLHGGATGRIVEAVVHFADQRLGE